MMIIIIMKYFIFPEVTFGFTFVFVLQVPEMDREGRLFILTISSWNMEDETFSKEIRTMSSDVACESKGRCLYKDDRS